MRVLNQILGTALATILIYSLFVLIAVAQFEPPTYSPSVPTPGVEGLQQRVTTLESQVATQSEAIQYLITNLQDVANEDITYNNLTGHVYEWTKAGFITSDPAASNRGFVEVAVLIAAAQTFIDWWEAIKAGLVIE